MSPFRIWLMAARPRTLPAAIAPVLVGTAAAYFVIEETQTAVAEAITVSVDDPSINWLAFAAALVGSILIQIGTNLANDYSDAKRGADTADRLGPVRVTSAGLIAPKRVLHATWIAFGARGARGHLPRHGCGAGDPRSSASSRSPPASSTPAGRGPTATRGWASSSSSSSSASSP